MDEFLIRLHDSPSVYSLDFLPEEEDTRWQNTWNLIVEPEKRIVNGQGKPIKV